MTDQDRIFIAPDCTHITGVEEKELLRVVNAIPESEFDMLSYVRTGSCNGELADRLEEYENCGTSACVLGWCLMDDWFIDDGFKDRFLEAHIRGPNHVRKFVSVYFDMDKHCVNKLFYGSHETKEVFLETLRTITG